MAQRRGPASQRTVHGPARPGAAEPRFGADHTGWTACPALPCPALPCCCMAVCMAAALLLHCTDQAVPGCARIARPSSNVVRAPRQGAASHPTRSGSGGGVRARPRCRSGSVVPAHTARAGSLRGSSGRPGGQIGSSVTLVGSRPPPLGLCVALVVSHGAACYERVFCHGPVGGWRGDPPLAGVPPAVRTVIATYRLGSGVAQIASVVAPVGARAGWNDRSDRRVAQVRR